MPNWHYELNIPSECTCSLPLMEYTSWKPANPARRFLVFPNRYKTGVRKCNEFYWYDTELDNAWYKGLLYQMHFQLNPQQRQEVDAEIRSLEQLAVVQDELIKSKKNARFWTKTTLIMVALLLFFYVMN